MAEIDGCDSICVAACLTERTGTMTHVETHLDRISSRLAK